MRSGLNSALDKASAILVRSLAGLVGVVGRFAWLVVAASIALAAVAINYASKHLAVNTDTANMISQELPFRQRQEDFKAAYPDLVRTILVVIEARTPDEASRAAANLTDRLAARSDLIRSVYDPSTNNFFLQNGLLYLKADDLVDLADRVAQAQPLIASLAADPSLRGLLELLVRAIERADDPAALRPEFVDLVRQVNDVVESRLLGDPRYLSWATLFGGVNTALSGGRRLLVVQPALDFTRLRPARDAIAFIRSAAADFTGNERGAVSVRLTGPAALANEELESVTEGAMLAAGISFVLVLVLLLVGLKSIRLVFAAALTLAVGLAWTAGFAALAIEQLNLISVAFAVLFIGLGVDFGIHFTLRFKQDLDVGRGNGKALSATAVDVGPSLLLTAIAAGIGFYAFVPTQYVGLAELGIISGTSMFIALAANLVLLPALLEILHPRAVARTRVPSRVEFGVMFSRHPVAVLVPALVLALGAAFVVPAASFDSDPINLKDPDTESVKTLEALIQDGSIAPFILQIVAPDIKTANALKAQVEDLDAVKRAVTITDYLPREVDDKRTIIDEMALFLTPVLAGSTPAPPPTRAELADVVGSAAAKIEAATAAAAGEAAQPVKRLALVLGRLASVGATQPWIIQSVQDDLLQFFPEQLRRLRMALEPGDPTLDDLPADLRERYIANDGRIRVEVFAADDTDTEEDLADFVAAVRQVAPGVTGAPILILESRKAVVQAMWQAGATALVLIALLLIPVLRNLRDLLLVLTPLVLAALLTVATSVVLNQPFNFANVIILPLLLGLGVASGIHLVMRRRTVGSGIALFQSSTPRAVIFSALTTIGSFGSLMVSHHRGTASMGLLLTVAIFFTLVCTIVVLPALASWLERREAASVDAARTGTDAP